MNYARQVVRRWLDADLLTPDAVREFAREHQLGASLQLELIHLLLKLLDEEEQRDRVRLTDREVENAIRALVVLQREATDGQLTHLTRHLLRVAAERPEAVQAPAAALYLAEGMQPRPRLRSRQQELLRKLLTGVKVKESLL